MHEHTLFEDGYLVRSLGSVAQQADVAISELVANAWDAGASRVDITIPDDNGGPIIVSDDGVGLTPDQFRERWMKLGYSRVKHQGNMAEFPMARGGLSRRSYGRNGIGRHGLLCFADSYVVDTRRDGRDDAHRFVVELSSGESPFDLIAEEEIDLPSSGTHIWTNVRRCLPSVDRIRDTLSFRFLHDPQFAIYVNGALIAFDDHKLVARTEFALSDRTQIEVICVEVPSAKRRKTRHGVAFWNAGRLVGDPMYNLLGVQLLDGRSTVANRHMVVVKSDDLFDDILPDWTGFRRSERIEELADEVSAYIDRLIAQVMSSRMEDNMKEAIRDNREEIIKLDPLARLEINQFVTELVTENPTLNPGIIAAAVKAVVNLEKSRSGQQLLEKLATIAPDDVDRLNKLLDSWTVRDALVVLDEIDRRLAVVEAIGKLTGDADADELHTIHPLVTQARWLFGPEFESPVFASNITIAAAAERVFKRRIDPSAIYNPRQRPDLIFLNDATVSLTGTEAFDETGTVTALQTLLQLELKRGNARIGLPEMGQAVQYADDLLNCGLLDGEPFIHAFVVGHEVDRRVRPRIIGDKPTTAKVEAVSFGQLVRTANHRLFKLHEQISERYRAIPGAELVNRVLGEPQQATLFPERKKKSRKSKHRRTARRRKRA